MGRQMESAIKGALAAIGRGEHPRPVLHARDNKQVNAAAPAAEKGGNMDRVQPLDFERMRHERPATMIECASIIVKGFGKDGGTASDIQGVVQKNLPQFKPASVGPALSKLVMVGALRVENDYGVRRYYHARDYDPTDDWQKIRQHEDEMARRRAETGMSPGQRASQRNAPVLAQQQAQSKAAMIVIGLGGNRTEVVDIQTAREIYVSLKALFG